MTCTAVPVALEAILPLRDLYLEEMAAQVRYHACHERGWTDSYLLRVERETVGYASIKGQEITDRDTVFEFFVAPSHRRWARDLFLALLEVVQPTWAECQSNDPLLTPCVLEFARDLSSDVILFADACETELPERGAVVRSRLPEEVIFPHMLEPVGEFVVEIERRVVATGGFLTHYNPPFADLFLEVHPEFRGRGLGGYLLQELKRRCYSAGRTPAARCGITNQASRGSLAKAGMRPCGYMLLGRLS